MNVSTFKMAIACFPLLLLSCKTAPGKPAGETSHNIIRIKGSDTEYAMVQHLADAYMAEHANIKITVEGGGSNKGIEALMDNATDICNSSREIKAPELTGINNKNIKPVPIIFSVDALAIITNYKIGVDSLSVQQVSSLFSGEIKNWKELGGDDIPVTLFGRDKSSGSRDYFNEKFLSVKGAGQIKECKTNSEIVTAVINTPGAIGYIGAGFLLDANGKPNGKVWAMPVYIDGHPSFSPYQAIAVKRGDYVLTRPLYQYMNGTPSQLIQDFILFELTKHGQEIIMPHGFFPINDYQTQINRLKGIID